MGWLTTTVHGTYMECIVAHCIFNAVEECRNLLIRLFRHSCQHIFNQVRLVAPTRLNNQFAWRSTLFRKNTHQFLALARPFSFVYLPIIYESLGRDIQGRQTSSSAIVARIREVDQTLKGIERSSFNFCLNAICVPVQKLANRSYAWDVYEAEGYQWLSKWRNRLCGAYLRHIRNPARRGMGDVFLYVSSYYWQGKAMYYQTLQCGPVNKDIICSAIYSLFTCLSSSFIMFGAWKHSDAQMQQCSSTVHYVQIPTFTVVSLHARLW